LYGKNLQIQIINWSIRFPRLVRKTLASCSDSTDAKKDGGDKGGADQRRFYKRLLTVADERYDEHLGTLNQSGKESKHGKKTR
jgi:hypothetical protein